MGKFARLRKWANRDDGRLFRVGNEPLGVLTSIGATALVGALILWQLDRAWAVFAGATGLILLIVGRRPASQGDDT